MSALPYIHWSPFMSSRSGSIGNAAPCLTVSSAIAQENPPRSDATRTATRPDRWASLSAHPGHAPARGDSAGERSTPSAPRRSASELFAGLHTQPPSTHFNDASNDEIPTISITLEVPDIQISVSDHDSSEQSRPKQPALAAGLQHNLLSAYGAASAPLTLEGSQKFSSLQPMDGRYAGENKGVTFDGKVKYLSHQERQAYKITVGADGRIYDAQGKPVDTRGSVTLGDQARDTAIYACDRNGDIFISKRHVKGQFQHSSLVAGEAVACAGELRIENGFLMSKPTRRSGHYKCTEAQHEEFLAHLISQGAKIFGED